MSITSRLNEALKPLGFSARRLPNDDPEMCDDAVEILDANQQVLEIEVQIYDRGGYGVNLWNGDGFTIAYSGRSAAAAVSAVLDAIKVPA
jgi:hypothetical protein